MANCDNYIAVCGGNSIMSSMFGGTVISYVHKGRAVSYTHLTLPTNREV